MKRKRTHRTLRRCLIYCRGGRGAFSTQTHHCSVILKLVHWNPCKRWIILKGKHISSVSFWQKWTMVHKKGIRLPPETRSPFGLSRQHMRDSARKQSPYITCAEARWFGVNVMRRHFLVCSVMAHVRGEAFPLTGPLNLEVVIVQ